MIDGRYEKNGVVEIFHKSAKLKCGPDIGPDVIDISPRNRKERPHRPASLRRSVK